MRNDPAAVDSLAPPRVGASATATTMTRSTVKLPADADVDIEVYVNGVLQKPDVDFHLDGRVLIFDRALRKDRISRGRWLLGAWGVGTYRQDDTVDIRYTVDGEIRLQHAALITLEHESGDQR